MAPWSWAYCNPDDDKVRVLDAQLAKYSKLGGKKIPYSFFSSETAQVWDGPPEEPETT